MPLLTRHWWIFRNHPSHGRVGFWPDMLLRGMLDMVDLYLARNWAYGSHCARALWELRLRRVESYPDLNEALWFRQVMGRAPFIGEPAELRQQTPQYSGLTVAQVRELFGLGHADIGYGRAFAGWHYLGDPAYRCLYMMPAVAYYVHHRRYRWVSPEEVGEYMDRKGPLLVPHHIPHFGPGAHRRPSLMAIWVHALLVARIRAIESGRDVPDHDLVGYTYRQSWSTFSDALSNSMCDYDG